MTHAAGLSTFVLAATAVLVLLGAVLALVGSLGLLRLETFYDRVHAPTMGTTLGTACVLAASMLLFTASEARPVLQEVVIAIMMTVTTPVTFMLLVRAALYRDQAEGSDPTGSEKTPGNPPESPSPAGRRTKLP